jgi:hypothetical protein
MTGDAININSLLNSKLDNEEITSTYASLDKNTENELDKKPAYSASQKRALQIVGIFVLNILLKKFLIKKL